MVDVELGGVEEVREFLMERLLDGWIILEGDREGIGEIEEQFYPPGTEKNGGFGLIIGWGYGIIIVRKRELVEGGVDVGDNDIIANVKGVMDRGAVLEMRSLPEGLSREERIELIEAYVLEPFDELTGNIS